MKQLLFFLVLFFSYSVIGQSGCDNIDFEDGNLNGWYIEGPAEIVNRSDIDYYGNFHKAISGSFSIKLGNEFHSTPSQASRTFLVTQDTRYFIYSYANVMAGGHGPDESAKFTIQVQTEDNSIIPCTSLIAYAVPGEISGYEMSDIGFEGEPIYYKKWESNVLDLSNYVGQTLTIKLTSTWCIYDYHWSYAYIDSYCTSQMIFTQKDCFSDKYEISTVPGFDEYVWNGPGIVSGQGTSIIEVDIPGNYTVDIPNQTVGCDSLHLEINTNLDELPTSPLVTFESDTSCMYQEVVFENLSIGGSSPITNCSWFVNGEYSTSSWNFPYTPLVGDSVLIKLVCENESGCTDSTELWYQPLSFVKFQLLDDILICPGEQVALYEINGYHGNLAWSDGTFSDTCIVANEGVYFATFSQGICQAIDSVYVNSYSMYLGEIPNVITPNHDLVNDIFDLSVINIADYHLVITNRWGNLVFESFDDQIKWDATVQGEPVEAGVYFYEFTYTCNILRSKKGFVEVIR